MIVQDFASVNEDKLTRLENFLLIKFPNHVNSVPMSELGDAFRFLARGFQYPTELKFIQIGWEVIEKLSKDLSITVPTNTPPQNLKELQTEYVRLFISSPLGVAAPPYASYYMNKTGLLLQEGAQEALRFYREIGVEPENSSEPPDHISLELAFVGMLLDQNRVHLLNTFIKQHMMIWYPNFLKDLLKATPSYWYQQLGLLTQALLEKITRKEELDEAT